jgi:hypothetical protein
MGAAAQVLWNDRNPLPAGPSRNPAKLNGRQRDLIGERLRQMYAALQDEPLSPRLREVLERLAQGESEAAVEDAAPIESASPES